MIPVGATLLFVLWPQAGELLHPGNPFISRMLWSMFMGIQSFFIFLLTPGLTGGVVSSERENGTLEMLLLTRVGTLALVWQKFLAVVVFVAYIPLIFTMLIPILYTTSTVTFWRRAEVMSISC